MATTYRLQKPKHNQTILSGEGSRLMGGRFNPVGVPLIYTSLTVSLAILEMRVHIDKPPLYKFPPLSLVSLEVPDECIHQFALTDLPKGWDALPVCACGQQFLVPYLLPGNPLAFSLPSVVNRFERNILINPLHPDISRVVIKGCELFNFDCRL